VENPRLGSFGGEGDTKISTIAVKSPLDAVFPFIVHDLPNQLRAQFVPTILDPASNEVLEFDVDEYSAAHLSIIPN
jgi:hypothetical protein